MTNFQIYRKILSFSLLMFLVDLLSLALLVGLGIAGFFIAGEHALIGLAVGLLLGMIAMILINIFIKNRIKAAQISIMVKGITENQLPDRAFKAGFEEIKGRFGRITAFFFITNAIKGIFRQLGRTINRIGTAVGGQAGNSVTSIIDSAIQTLIAYLADCCLGWILYRRDVNVAKAGCEGAVIFFKHGKTLIRNVGRIFGMGFLSFLLIGGGSFGIIFLILNSFPDTFSLLSQELIKVMGSEAPEFASDVLTLTIVVSAFGGLFFWVTMHSVFIRPFILVGVMRNFMVAGQQDIPTESDFALLDARSSKFARLHNSME